MTVSWSQAARQVSDEWIREGRMPLDPNGWSGDGARELALWDEIERRVTRSGAADTEADELNRDVPLHRRGRPDTGGLALALVTDHS